MRPGDHTPAQILARACMNTFEEYEKRKPASPLEAVRWAYRESLIDSDELMLAEDNYLELMALTT